MSQTFFINVSVGLMSEEHQKKIGTAIWEYLWCLNKMTKINNDGLGVILGGKPVKLEDIETYRDLKSKRRSMLKLEKEGYITSRRTPYGKVLFVTKPKKFFAKRIKSEDIDLPQIGSSETERPPTNREFSINERKDKSGRSDLPKVVVHPPQRKDKSGLSNKIIQYDNTVDNTYTYFQEKINKGSKLLDKAKDKIKARLKVYSLEDLKKAMDNFSADGWWMKNNAHRGVAWFFHSDERIEQLMNMKPKPLNNNINQPQVENDKYKDL